ncbi:DNA mismatch endonuclease Vsr [Paraburkholderia sp. LEh10]|uniref:very short patch repair endonuclease n=1 Tax=Paraburkholderia sp. LEh10 TaxID=2821353 RepID=UPI001AE26018|nr:very short patch repair endonuclease [Paraburkholderia sp. LEh10]MBP0594581.1 DNA mismatch endonuclease Vsr [Paraburkholderia sp. LEh10]
MATRSISSTPATRSTIMRAIRGKDTKPELAVRSLLHAQGYRYRVHGSELPGTPDIVFPGRKKVIFVHGCFWHRHDCQSGKKQVKANIEYWGLKFARNVERDAINRETLAKMGWDVLTLWECELVDVRAIAVTLADFLGPVKLGKRMARSV